ncbi:response regulator transcription factor [Phosphitispora fastidiosa]|uniref:response regulator transcription factor n=1 Tax=Phosphitispora fastidiosa TaxID=2837202 RepID=UPI001E3E4636|nr:response regulator transcription factor [Phosphitispora fastidiosa]MBU7008600.1 two-component system alkaline phosphatase synthesis response regulator PhoP [Phosphitispora fastidiosa]
MGKPTILVVDDESHIVELVRFNLEKEGYNVISAQDGLKAYKMAAEHKPDLIVLDVMLPEMDGFEVCRQIQKDIEMAEIPIIMLTARSEEIDKVLGLEIGADDYITKPFSPRELIARVKARLRRITAKQQNPEISGQVIRINDLIIDPDRFEVVIDGTRLELTPKEFELLRILAKNRGRVLSREFLLETIWGYEYIGDSRTVDVHIRHLRQKLESDPANPRYIETVRGVGYKFKEKS